MPSLLERLSADLKNAMRAGDAVRRDEIRGVIAALKAEQQSKLTQTLSKHGLILHGDNAVLSPEQEAEIDRLRASSMLSDDEAQAVLVQRVKQHRQSIDAFSQGKRFDLVRAEEAQLAIDQTYLPEQVDAAAVHAAIQTAIRDSGAQTARDQGKVMQLLSARLRGRADMKAVSARVQALLTHPAAN
ncbi:MAG: GatB/YqeY domain-containing protein [Chloroflexota bacterium]|nr:GatB/YqeY domain-containing protein [Chloroflexota bacterium]